MKSTHRTGRFIRLPGRLASQRVMLPIILLTGSLLLVSHLKPTESVSSPGKKTAPQAAGTDCKCSLTGGRLAGNLSTADYQTDNLDQATVLMAGTTMQIRVYDPAGSFQDHGIWTATFGSIDGNGNYTAPSYMPPYGVDTIDYNDNNGNIAHLKIRVTANPAIPGSGNSKYVVYDPTAGASTASQSVKTNVVVTDPPENLFPTTGETTIVVAPGETPPAQADIVSSEPIAPVTIQGSQGYQLPALDDTGAPTNVLYVLQRTVPNAPIKAQLTNTDPIPLTIACIGDQLQAQWGPYSVTNRYLSTVNLADISVSAEIAAEVWKIFHIRLQVNGTVHVQGIIYEWTRTRRKYVYKCVNNHWVLQYTRVCVSKAIGCFTIPSWVAKYEGYPANGAPGPYGPEACHP